MTHDLPETVLQFGSGKFLRAFADLFVHQANEAGQSVGGVVVVQSTGRTRADQLNRQQGRYRVLVRGQADGVLVDRVEESASNRRALVAESEWAEVQRVGRSRELRWIISNTAEAGYDLNAADRPGAAPPASFPAKLLLMLRDRFDCGAGGVTIVPCELFEQNADRLRDIVSGLAAHWEMAADFVRWMHEECCWLNTLVDRIVVDPPPDHPLSAADPLLCLTEPYALWAVEDNGELFEHQAIRRAADVRPFFLRKVRILNAAHTALVAYALPRGIRTVREAVQDHSVRGWLGQLLFEEIVPVLEGRVEDPAGFARQTLERFANPFLEHRLQDIAVYHAAKARIRLQPTRAEYLERFGRNPPRLDEALAAVPTL